MSEIIRNGVGYGKGGGVIIRNGVTYGGKNSSTLATKSISANGDYTASSDGVDGYSVVSVSVPQPTISSTQIVAEYDNFDPTDSSTQYLDDDQVFSILAPAGTSQAGDLTVAGVTYHGIAITDAATIASALPLSGTYQVLEYKLIITSLGAGDARIISTGGTFFEMSLWHNSSIDYLQYCSDQGTIIDTDNIVALDTTACYDTSITKASLVNTVLHVKYVYDGTYVMLYVNDVAKIRWSAFQVLGSMQGFGMHVGANGATATPDEMFVAEAKYTGRVLTYNGETWMPN